MNIFLLFPHQLFAQSLPVDCDQSYLIEDPLFFSDWRYTKKFHVQKRVLHRATMRCFFDEQAELFPQQTYIEYQDICTKELYEKWFEKIFTKSVREVHIYDPTDYILHKRLETICRKHQRKLIVHDSPNFFFTAAEVDDILGKQKRYYQTDMYIEARKRWNILIDDGEPRGGKWTYDSDNRKKMPKNMSIPSPVSYIDNQYVQEAINYVQQHFPDSYGNIDHWYYPISRAQAQEVLKTFFEEKFQHFGDYQDALVAESSYNFHSLLSSSINIGLLSPQEMVNEALKYAEQHEVPLNALEGFIRQIMGWREFIRGLYIREGVSMRQSNFWEHQRAMPAAFYTASTGIEPVDDVIRRLLQNSYSHHIERLMVLGNFMLLCEINPQDIYIWFMELYIDAYDWVMVPNVYGMSQYADGGQIVTKPYISSSNYIRKMSNYAKGDWCEIWDALYWRFIDKHRDFFLKNPRLSLMPKILEQKGEKQVAQYHHIADTYFNNL